MASLVGSRAGSRRLRTMRQQRANFFVRSSIRPSGRSAADSPPRRWRWPPGGGGRVLRDVDTEVRPLLSWLRPAVPRDLEEAERRISPGWSWWSRRATCGEDPPAHLSDRWCTARRASSTAPANTASGACAGATDRHARLRGSGPGQSAWVAWREQRMDEAEKEARTALECWSELSAIYPYPFQWQGLWVLLAMELQRQAVSEAVDRARACWNQPSSGWRIRWPRAGSRAPRVSQGPTGGGREYLEHATESARGWGSCERVCRRAGGPTASARGRWRPRSPPPLSVGQDNSTYVPAPASTIAVPQKIAATMPCSGRRCSLEMTRTFATCGGRAAGRRGRARARAPASTATISRGMTAPDTRRHHRRAACRAAPVLPPCHVMAADVPHHGRPAACLPARVTPRS